MDKLDILVIEDGRNDFLFLKKHLQGLDDWNFNVLSAESFFEAKKIMASQTIDIILLDYYIDNKIADNFLIEIQYFREYVPVVIISDRDINELKALALDSKVDDFLSKKDITKPLLTRIIKYCITQNKQRLIAKTQKEKYQNLFHNSMEAIFTADENYHILTANKSFKEMIRVENISDEFNFRDLFVEDEYENYFSALSPGAERNINRIKLKRADGKILEAYLAISRILSDNESASYQVVIHDITDLEELQNQMHEADKMKLIQRMARIIGHEIRNPLTNILLATEEMKQDLVENDDAVFMLGMIHRNSKRISTLIDGFLTNTRSTETNIVEVILENVVKEAFENCKDRIILKYIKYRFDGFNGSTKLNIDPKKIMIVFTNIIINAIEALNNIQNPEVNLKLVKDENNVEISIIDNGVGMTDEVKKNLFSPFYSNKQGGLGLGMANSKNILSEHNAEIKVESEMGVGTSFQIKFPLT